MRKKIQVFSPHFDDAVLSCGQHMLHWVAAGHAVEVVTVFTVFTSVALSEDSRDFLHASGVRSVEEMQSIRSEEDAAAMRALGVTHRWLGFVDGGFRESGDHPVYPTHAVLFSGQILDTPEWIEMLEATLRTAIDPEAWVVAPLGIGSHADHILVGEIVKKNVRSEKLLRYADMPYALRLEGWSLGKLRHLLQMNVSVAFDSEKKLQILEQYASQLDGVFLEKGYSLFELVLGSTRLNGHE